MEYKAKFSCVCQDGLRGSGDVLPRIVNFSTRVREMISFRLRPLIPWERAPC